MKSDEFSVGNVPTLQTGKLRLSKAGLSSLFDLGPGCSEREIHIIPSLLIKAHRLATGKGAPTQVSAALSGEGGWVDRTLPPIPHAPSSGLSLASTLVHSQEALVQPCDGWTEAEGGVCLPTGCLADRSLAGA